MQQRQGLVRAGIFMLFLRIHRVASRSCTSAFVTSSVSRLSVGSEAPSRRSFWSNSGNRSPPTSQRRGDILRRYASDQPDDTFFAEELDFASMGVQSTVLLGRLERMGLQRPTAVQSAAFKAIREEDSGDLTIGAETGSGKVRKRDRSDSLFSRRFRHGFEPRQQRPVQKFLLSDRYRLATASSSTRAASHQYSSFL
jgi:hypothetical protein